MKRILGALILSLVLPLQAQVVFDSVRLTDFDFACVKNDVIISKHQRQDKALTACQNALLATPDSTFEVISGRWRVSVNWYALAQVYPGANNSFVPDPPDPEAAIYWPEQGAVGYLPAVRNRNPSTAPVVAEGRGWGMDTRHAYTDWDVDAQTGTTPTLYHVTNENSSGAGSLQAALTASGPRIIVFDIGGNFPASNINVSNAKIWVAGQTAPDLVFIETANPNSFNITSGDQFWQHVAICNVGSVSVSRDAVTMENVSTPFNNVIFDHVLACGGTDETLTAVQRANDVTVIDSIVARPRSHITTGEGFCSLFGSQSSASDDFFSFVGNLYAHCHGRSPLTYSEHIAIANHLSYNRGNHGVEVSGNDSATDHFINIVGLWEKRGPDYTTVGGHALPIRIRAHAPTAQYELSTTSEVFISDCRATEYSSDEWDCVNDPDAQEADVRVEAVNEGWPEGLVAAPNRTVSEADYLTLMIQNAGPCPNDPAHRITFIQDIVDNVIDGTGAIENDYAFPTVSSATETFVPVANPNEENGTSGRTNLEDQLLDLAEACLN